MLKKIKEFLFENKTAKQTVAKNTVWLWISQFGARAIKIAVIVYAARVLGAAGYGVFSYAVTLAGFLTLFVDPGINSVLVRDGAKATPEERRSIFSSMFVMKLIILAISVAIVIGIAPYFSTLPGAKELLPLVALIIIFDGLREFFASMVRAEERMERDAASFLVENFGIVVFGFLFLAISTTPFSFTAAYVAASLVGAFVAAWFLRGKFGNIFKESSAKRMLGILKTAWPFAVTGALGILFTNTDILILSWMKTAADVGVYSAAIRVIQSLYILPMVIQMGTMPLFARLAKNDDERFRALLERTAALIFLVSIPLSIGGIVLGTPIMAFVFGPAYAVGGLALSLLMLNLSFDYAGTIFASGIFAYDHQKNLIISSAIGGVSNVVFDLLFIPTWGMAGSACATLIAQILSNAYLWYAMRQLNRFSIIPRLGRIALASAIMGAVTIVLFIAGVHVIVNVIVSAAVYAAALYLLREPLLGEVGRIVGLRRAEA